MAFGLVAFLVANVATFAVATQAYSDLFILLILGWALGFLLAMPVLAAGGDGVRRRPSQLLPGMEHLSGVFAPAGGAMPQLRQGPR